VAVGRMGRWRCSLWLGVALRISGGEGDEVFYIGGRLVGEIGD
jgi:hypothetical protein